jgi:hypothetical protein
LTCVISRFSSLTTAKVRRSVTFIDSCHQFHFEIASLIDKHLHDDHCQPILFARQRLTVVNSRRHLVSWVPRRLQPTFLTISFPITILYQVFELITDFHITVGSNISGWLLMIMHFPRRFYNRVRANIDE